tara:strand:- start:132 stop:959 length:828 start_codon:yes stop_codon:yes gene_type:complete
MSNPANEIDVGKIKLVWRGTYAGATAYEVDDLVLYDDSQTVSSYICVQDSTGNAPSSSGTVNTTYWNLVAKGSSAAAAGSVDNVVQLKSGTGFAADGLFIFNTSTNRLGINSDTPTATVDVLGVTTTTRLTVGDEFNATGISTISDTFNVSEVLQTVSVVAGAANATSNLDIKTASAFLFTSNSGDTWTHNIRGDGSTTLDSMMSVGQIMTVKVVSAQNDATHYSANITIDGAAQTELWVNSSAPTGGKASGYDTYTWTILKTGSATFTTFATQS